MDDLWVQKINMPNTFSRQAKPAPQKMNRGVAHYCLVGAPGVLPRPTLISIIQPGGTGGRVEGRKPELEECRDPHSLKAADYVSYLSLQMLQRK